MIGIKEFIQAGPRVIGIHRTQFDAAKRTYTFQRSQMFIGDIRVKQIDAVQAR